MENGSSLQRGAIMAPLQVKEGPFSTFFLGNTAPLRKKRCRNSATKGSVLRTKTVHLRSRFGFFTEPYHTSLKMSCVMIEDCQCLLWRRVCLSCIHKVKPICRKCIFCSLPAVKALLIWTVSFIIFLYSYKLLCI